MHKLKIRLYIIVLIVISMLSCYIGFIVQTSIGGNFGVYVAPKTVKTKQEDKYNESYSKSVQIADKSDGTQSNTNYAMKLIGVARAEADLYANDASLKGGLKYLGTGDAWCCAFVYWCASQAGLIGDGPECAFGKSRIGYCGTSYECMRNLGYDIHTPDDGYTPVMGDLVYYTNGSDYAHIGIVEEVSADGHLHTIEGNTSPYRSGRGSSCSTVSRKDRTTCPFNSGVKNNGIKYYCHVKYMTIANAGCNLASGKWVFDANKSNQQNVYNFLRIECGLNTAACAGAMANIDCESAHTWNPAIEEYGRPLGNSSGLGLIQWSYGRRTDPNTGLMGWCKNNGYDPLTIEGNMRFLKYELTEKSYKNTVLIPIQQVSNDENGANAACETWVRHFEVPAKVDYNVTLRKGYVHNTWWSECQQFEKELA